MASEQHVGVSALHSMNKTVLAKQKKVVVIHDHSEPIAVLIPYPLYMMVQELRKRKYFAEPPDGE